MPDDGDRNITERELDLRLKNIDQSLEHITEVVDDLKALKDILNPAFTSLHQQVQFHIEQDQQEKARRRERWSPWQIALMAILAAATVGMFIVALIK